jgi:DNA-binding NarL/FixJ family response regulator
MKTRRTSHSTARVKRSTAATAAPAARSARPLQIIVADAQVMDRKGMIGLLATQPDLQVVAEAGSIGEAIALHRLHNPDVLIVSLGLRGPEDDSPIRAARSSLPAARILAISERGFRNCLVLNPPGIEDGSPRGTCELATDCLQLAAAQGAHGALRRSAEPDDLFAAVRAVASGHAWYESGTASALASGELNPGVSPSGEALSDRELDVAALLSRGRSNKEIATTLEISEPTVKKHIGRILLKLGVQDRLQAGLFVARHPLLIRRERAR